MYPILARFGPFFIYSYTVVMALGIIFGLAFALFLGKRDGIKSDLWINGLLIAIIVGLIGGRILFVISNIPYYIENPDEILLIGRGGLNYQGVLITALIFLGIWIRLKNHSVGPIALILAPSLAIISAFGWFACWLDGCGYGREAPSGFLVADLPDSFGVFALRYSTQILALVFCLLILGLTLVLRRYKFLWLPWLTLLLLSASRLIVSLLRGDSAPLVGSLRMDTLAEGVLVLFCFLAIAVAALDKSSAQAWEQSG